MAGLSSRFFREGYDKPKYMLEAYGFNLFQLSVGSFKQYFDEELFLFIIHDVYQTESFVLEQVNKLKIKRFRIVTLESETDGQAETVAVGIESFINEGNCIRSESLTIFNIDTFRPEFIYPKLEELGDGYLEVFQGEGSNWSFAEPESADSTIVKKTAEKQQISNLCSTGLYYFKKINDFLSSFYAYRDQPTKDWEKGELYIAPLYNKLIADGKAIHYSLIDRNEVVFCGVPEEYKAILMEGESKWLQSYR